MACGYSVGVGADVSLAANTVQSILGVRANAAFGIKLKKLAMSSRGSGSTVPTAIPLLVELCRATFATNPPGTNSTDEAAGIAQTYGLTIVHGVTAASAWTAGNEPTVLTVLDEFTLHPQQMMKEGLAFSCEYEAGLSVGFVLRVSNPTGNPSVPLRPMLHWERI